MQNIKERAKGLPVKLILNICRYMFFVSFGFVLIYPIMFLFSRAVMDYSDYFNPSVQWISRSFTLKNFITAFKALELPKSLWVTLSFEIVAALLQFCSCAVAAYGLARFKFRGRGIITAIMILTILVPSTMIITPSYVNFSQMDFLGILGLLSKITGHELRPNLIDTPFVFYLPSIFGVGLKGGLFIYIYTQFFKGLPKELEEAAAIDGAGPWKTFLRIVVPSSGNASITVLLFSVVWHWNDYYLSTMYLSGNRTLGAILYEFSTPQVEAAGIELSMLQVQTRYVTAAACLVFLIPILLFYLIMQRKFIASIATSGIVG